MKPIRIFISSVQKEFAEERSALRDFLRGDPLLRRFFEVFLFEEVPAKDRRADALYLAEVDQAAIYIGLFGNEYGSPDRGGFSPTHREFLRATELNKQRLIFVKGADDAARESKMKALIEEAATQLVRRRFSFLAELIAGVYASLVDYLADMELLRFGPFDAAICKDAEPLYLVKYIERMGTGVLDMVKRCRAAGLRDPEFQLTDGFVVTLRRKPGAAFEAVGGTTPQATPQATPQVQKLLASLSGDMSRTELMNAIGLKDRMHFAREYLLPALDVGLIEMTIPDKPKSPQQRYRLTQKEKNLRSIAGEE